MRDQGLENMFQRPASPKRPPGPTGAGELGHRVCTSSSAPWVLSYHGFMWKQAPQIGSTCKSAWSQDPLILGKQGQWSP